MAQATATLGDNIVGTTASAPHPYGARPKGNALLASPAQARVRPLGLGFLAAFPDEMLLEFLLAFLGPLELARAGTAGRTLYVLGHQPELWRNLALDECGGGKVSVPFAGTWKDTCAAAFRANRRASAAAAAVAASEVHEVGRLHVPFSVEGIFSDALYRPWCCAAAEVQPRWLTCPRGVPRRCGLSVNDFVAQFEGPNTPVILTDVVTAWPAFERWRDPTYLAAVCGDALFRATSLGASRAASFTMGDYLVRHSLQEPHTHSKSHTRTPRDNARLQETNACKRQALARDKHSQETNTRETYHLTGMT